MSGSFRLKPLLIALAIPQAVGLIGSLLAGDMSAMYAALDKPAFASPGWLFGVVWPVLYLLLGIASWMIWRTPESAARTRALTFYAVQLVLNLLWPPLFFRLGLLRPAFWELSALLVLTIVMAACFLSLRRIAGLLVVPYCVWLAYAAAVNRAVVALSTGF
ncbi:TspO/MBR family protein [Anaerotruncus colihominis]|uniref:TspO/MBR family protein n=1 Tax=Anaerotruncus colihominis TaxID=169435 RepID=UPI0035180CC9